MRKRAHAVSAAMAATLAAAGAWAAPGVPAGAVADARHAARVELGRRLFFDPVVSRTGRKSCASCHDPEHGFTDLAHPSQDEFGPMARRAMPVTDLPNGPMHADGEFRDVRDLLAARLVPFDQLDHDRRVAALHTFGLQIDPYGNLEGGRPGLVPVAQRVAADGFYASSFVAAFDDPTPTIDRVMDAVEAYVGSLRTGASPFDRYLAGEDAALAAPARRGLALYVGKANCGTCHLIAAVDGRPPLRDGKFHDTGISWRTAKAKGLLDPAKDGDLGRAAHERRGDDRRRDAMEFKTPSLRDVARRGPFMHDGSLATLADVVAYYDKGGARHPGLDAALHPLALSEDEKDDLLAFLLALSAPERAGLAAPTAAFGRATTVRLVDPDGKPIAEAAVGVEPAGDRFDGDAPRPTLILLRSDATGRVTFPFPRCTHVEIRVEGHGVAGGRLLPDVAGDAELVAVPENAVAIRVLCDGTDLPDQIRAVPTATVDARTRPVAPQEGDALVFVRSLKISASEAVYVARPSFDKHVSVRRTLIPKGAGGAAMIVQADVDLSPGGFTSIDMRPPRPATSLTGPSTAH